MWAADITYLPLAHGWAYLAAIIDCFSRAVLAWRLSNSLTTQFCIEALQEALCHYGPPGIFNTDQGAQFTDQASLAVLKAHPVRISMDGKGRCMDNIFVERLWRSLKYEVVAASAIAMAVAALSQQRASPAPLLPRRLLGERTLTVGLAGGAAAGGALYATSAYVPLWMVRSGQFSPAVAGLALIPVLGGWALGATFAIRVLLRAGLRGSVGGGLLMASLGAGLLAANVRFDGGLAALFLCLGVLGVGLGAAASTSIYAPQARAAWHERGAVTSALYAARALGGSLTVAMLGSSRQGLGSKFIALGLAMALVAAALAWMAPGAAPARMRARSQPSASPRRARTSE